MNHYICHKCGKTSHSAAELKSLLNPECPYCHFDPTSAPEEEGG